MSWQQPSIFLLFWAFSKLVSRNTHRNRSLSPQTPAYFCCLFSTWNLSGDCSFQGGIFSYLNYQMSFWKIRNQPDSSTGGQQSWFQPLLQQPEGTEYTPEWNLPPAPSKQFRLLSASQLLHARVHAPPDTNSYNCTSSPPEHGQELTHPPAWCQTHQASAPRGAALPPLY